MPRYFIEVSYRGTSYSGFQVQKNANTIQAELEKALFTFFRQTFQLTGSSRTDAGVHASQNFFHVELEDSLPKDQSYVYNLNAILPEDIVVKSVKQVKDNAHCRFDALSRSYEYHLYREKDPFIGDRAYYYPYKLDLEIMNEVAAKLISYSDFTSFSKRNSQVKTFNCRIYQSLWEEVGNQFCYRVRGDRFLRGMVRGLVGTMLKVGTCKISLKEFDEIVVSRDCANVDFSVPAHGLFLKEVSYPTDVFI